MTKSLQKLGAQKSRSSNVLLPKPLGDFFFSKDVSSLAFPPFLWMLYRVYHLKIGGFLTSPKKFELYAFVLVAFDTCLVQRCAFQIPK